MSANKRKWRDRGGGPEGWLGYVMSTKVIFRRAEGFVLAEVCLPRRPHAVLPRSHVFSEKRKWRHCFSFKHQTEVGLHADVSEDWFPLEQRLRSSKNNFRGHIPRAGLGASLSVPSFSLAAKYHLALRLHTERNMCKTPYQQRLQKTVK